MQEAQKNLAAAEQGYLEAVRVYEQVLGRFGHPNLIDTYANLGSLLAKTAQFRDREGISVQGAGPEPAAARRRTTRWSATITRTSAASTTTTGNNAAACEQFKKALEIYLANVKRKRLPRKHPYIDEARIWLKRAGC